jgi:uncharacterized protein YgbK (DUF1537 family)
VTRAPDVVLDDDPTGTQAVTGVPVVLDIDADHLRRVAQGARAVHVLTNVRALEPAAAERLTYAAAGAARAALPRSRIVLRGDSTLRGHVLEEVRAVTRAAFDGVLPVLLLVPALPAAGRVTRGGVHWLTADGDRRPLHETEFARDGTFAYGSSRLLAWADERTGGLLAAADGTEVDLDRLRADGAGAVRDAILAAGAVGRPAACAPDAETVDDLRTIAAGLVAAETAGARVLVRCAPTFAGVLSGSLAPGPVPAPRAGDGGTLVVCGSYVSGTTLQLEHLRDALGLEPIEPDVRALASPGDADQEAERVAAHAGAALADDGLALVATPRVRPAGLTSLDAGERIARGLAQVVARLPRLPDVLVAKGGITSQVVLEHGVGVREAHVAGPVATGVALWDVTARGRALSYLVFPGNVGGPDHLTAVVRMVR